MDCIFVVEERVSVLFFSRRWTRLPLSGGWEKEFVLGLVGVSSPGCGGVVGAVFAGEDVFGTDCGREEAVVSEGCSF